MTSRRPYWRSKTMKRRPCWCTKPILWELDSFLMQTFSFVPINLHRCWTRNWKRSICGAWSIINFIVLLISTLLLLLLLYPQTGVKFDFVWGEESCNNLKSILFYGKRYLSFTLTIAALCPLGDNFCCYWSNLVKMERVRKELHEIVSKW